MLLSDPLSIGRIDFEKETPAADLSVLGSLYFCTYLS
jgi:hypothetical protein